MKLSPDRIRFISLPFVFALVAFVLGTASAQLSTSAIFAQSTPHHAVASGGPGLCATCVRANLEYLAGPDLRGRGSGTNDEYHAAEFIARKLKQYGIAPAAHNGQYIQTATSESRTAAQAPVLSFNTADPGSSQTVSWTHGKEMAVFQLSEPEIQGPLQKLDLNQNAAVPDPVRDGGVVLLKPKPETSMKDFRVMLAPYLRSKAEMVIVPEFPAYQAMFERRSKQLPGPVHKIGDAPPGPAVIFARPEAAEQLWATPDGTAVALHASMTPWKASHTWNVLGKIAGEKGQVVLLSAHLDHLGVEGGITYPGADDDASGTVAVMELARVLAARPKLQRTVVFALWGSEEAGMIGSRYFLKDPTFPLNSIVANLEFEMIARPDPKLERDQLWLTGWERSDMGAKLAQHGAKLVADPRPEQNFFSRSDNYPMAQQGIVAQTVSSFGLHPDYHQPTDTLAKVDWQHLDNAISSMIAPVTWLADSDFVPRWNAGQKP